MFSQAESKGVIPLNRREFLSWCREFLSWLRDVGAATSVAAIVSGCGGAGSEKQVLKARLLIDGAEIGSLPLAASTTVQELLLAAQRTFGLDVGIENRRPLTNFPPEAFVSRLNGKGETRESGWQFWQGRGLQEASQLQVDGAFYAIQGVASRLVSPGETIAWLLR